MSSMVWLLVAAAAAFILLLRSMALAPLDRAVRRALAERDLTPVREAMERIGPRARPTAYNHAIRRMWDAYERELATELIRELAAAHPESPIAQYWLSQALAAEPAIARATFTQSFLDTYYQPEVAARCGPAG